MLNSFKNLARFCSDLSSHGFSSLRMRSLSFLSGIFFIGFLFQGCGASSYNNFEKHTLYGHKDICIVSQYTPNMAKFAEIAKKNHEKYASKHGYTYEVYNGRISGQTFLDPSRGNENHLRGGGLYWQKVMATKNLMNSMNQDGTQPLCAWVFWVDTDILFTDMNTSIESLIARWDAASERGVETSLFLPKDESGVVPTIKINNGAYLLKNNAWGKAFIQAIEDSYAQYKDDSTPEQDAFQDYVYQEFKTSAHRPARVFDESRVQREVVLVPQRAFDSFYRPGYSDPVSAKWQRGDFIAHFSGISNSTRVSEMKKVIHDLGL